MEDERCVRRRAGPRSGLQRDGSHRCVINICTSAALGGVTAEMITVVQSLRTWAAELRVCVSVCVTRISFTASY